MGLPRQLRTLTLLAALAGSTASAPPAASADPVRPRATPLAILAGGPDTRCPSVGEVSGQQITSLVGRHLRGDSLGAFLVLSLFPSLPTPAVVVCDPDQVGSSQPLGPFGGATHHDLTADVVFPGTRALGTAPEEMVDSELVPGDRVELPAAGARAALTVMVATSNGAVPVQLPALGSPLATAVRIEGSLSAPVVVVERAAAEPTRLPVAAASKVSTRVVPELHGRKIRFHGTAAPGTIIAADSSSGEDADLVVAPRSGRFKGLSVDVGPNRRSITISLANLPRRQGFEVHCTARWNKARKLADKISCKALRAARATGAAQRAVRTMLAGHRANDAASAVSTAPSVASGAAALKTVEASVTALATLGSDDGATLAGDLNGDGRPDVAVNGLYDDAPHPRLVVSQAAGRGVSIPIRIDKNDFAPLVDGVADLDGDGRDELSSGTGVVVTDALAAPTLPSRIDLRTLRVGSPRDLDLGVSGLSSGFADLLTPTEPVGSVADATGDGRPEIVLELEGLSVIFPSQAIVPGVKSRLAQVFPLAFADELGESLDALDAIDSDEALDGFPSDAAGDNTFADIQAAGAAGAPGSVLVGGRLVTLAPADPTIAETRPRTFLLRTFGGGPLPTATASFDATGVPQLLDVDPVSGDVLVVLFQQTTCVGRTRCLDRVLRLTSTGQLRSAVALRRTSGRLSASFVADGPDADTAVDLAIWRSQVGTDRPTGFAGDGGTIALMTSAETGARQLKALPVLARGGTPIRAVGPGGVSVRVLPNGSRWLAAQTSERRRGGGTYALIAQTR